MVHSGLTAIWHGPFWSHSYLTWSILVFGLLDMISFLSAELSWHIYWSIFTLCSCFEESVTNKSALCTGQQKLSYLFAKRWCQTDPVSTPWWVSVHVYSYISVKFSLLISCVLLLFWSSILVSFLSAQHSGWHLLIFMFFDCQLLCSHCCGQCPVSYSGWEVPR